MASAQYENSNYLMCHSKNNSSKPSHDHEQHHSLSEKVKEMANSTKKLFHPHDHKPTGNNYGGLKTTTEVKKKKKTEAKKKKIVKDTEGHWMPKMLDHLRMKKNRDGRCIESSSDSDSDSSITRKKN